MKATRNGISLMELVVVLGIIAILIGLLLPAVQRVRDSAWKLTSANNLRQIALASQNYASSHDDMLPSELQQLGGSSVMAKLVENTESGPRVGDSASRPRRVKMYLSPADPSLNRVPVNTSATSEYDPEDAIPDTLSSYAYNATVFLGRHPRRITAAIPDGLSNTIMWSEHYSRCGTVDFLWDMTASQGMIMGFAQAPSYFAGPDQITIETSGSPPTSVVTLLKVPVTFQVQPCSTKLHPTGQPLPSPIPGCGSRVPCDYRLNQAPHQSGLLTALADGSLRTISPSISPAVFWGSVTPSGGEILVDW